MRFLWSSDHHTLHLSTPTTHVLKNLSKFLMSEHDLTKVDMVVFGGDFADRLVESPNTDMFLVESWVRGFLLFCLKVNPSIKVIWLEGTSSHDWGQPKHFLNLKPEGLDVRYIDELKIEYFEEHDDLSVMYVPDNMGSLTPDEIWNIALKVLTSNNLKEVDLIFFHGGFEFQLHPNARRQSHNLERWESITKYGIFAGHIHTPVQKGKLYTSGSFDRVAHGEEHAKGGYVVDLDTKTGYMDARFWENKNALPYVTFKVDKELTPEDLINQARAFIKQKNLIPNSKVRLLGGYGRVTNPVITALSKEFPSYGFKSVPEANDDIILTEEVYEERTYEGVTLNKDNLANSLLPELEDNIKANDLEVKEVLKVLEGFL